MEKVYLVIKAKSVDYHGTYHEVVSVYKNLDDAKALVEKLGEENHHYDTEYYYETYNLL